MTDTTKSMRTAAADSGYAVSWTDSKPPKLVLPPLPAHDDLAGLARWMSAVLNLDPAHPITGGDHSGTGRGGRVDLSRAGAPALIFEPASMLTSAVKLIDALVWQLQPTDGRPFGFKNEQAQEIAYVVRLLCGASAAATDEQETFGIIGTFQSGAVLIEGLTTYGTSAQRYEAADALRRDSDPNGRPLGPPHYLIDANTGELVIRVGDLQHAAREHVGSALAYGWLDGRVEHIGWKRITLDGHAVPGRDGRRAGGHLRVYVYRGLVPTTGGDENEAVNT